MRLPGWISRRAALVGGAAVVLAAAATGSAVKRSDGGRQEPVSVATDATTTTAHVVGGEALSSFAGSAQMTTTLAPGAPSTAPAVTTTTAAAAAATTATSTTALPTTVPATTATTAGPGGDHRAVQAALDAAKARWAVSKPLRGYTWRYTRHCFCPPPRHYEVEVDGAGRVVGVRGIDEGTTTSGPPRTLSGLTVEAAFKEVQGAIDRKAEMVSATFDSALGHPTRYSIDISGRMRDEEVAVSVSSLTPRA